MSNAQDRYLNQDFAEFFANGGRFEAFALAVFTRQVFGSDDPTDAELGIHSRTDLANALRAEAEAQGFREGVHYPKSSAYWWRPAAEDSWEWLSVLVRDGDGRARLAGTIEKVSVPGRKGPEWAAAHPHQAGMNLPVGTLPAFPTRELASAYLVERSQYHVND